MKPQRQSIFAALEAVRNELDAMSRRARARFSRAAHNSPTLQRKRKT